MSNIWTAASEGNAERVRELVESGTSPNALDENSYSPLHAAASWGHADILRYLVERGGDINLTDSDRETPLFVVENVGMAKLVVELGGDPKWTNEDGITVTVPAPVSSELDNSAPTTGAPPPQPDLDAPTDALMASVRSIMERSERGEISEQETDDLLREVVESAVTGQVEAGRAIGQQMAVDDEAQASGGSGRTRTRTADQMAADEQAPGKRARDTDDIGR
ncbi:ankyrin [Rhodotorula sp. JG-1b]|nr:ankyrin [Rhodotorula sp. JG-1b]